MAELTQKERLQPSLLDRLTDHEPDNRQESREKRVFSSNRLRDSVKRDLAWLFNTTNMAAGRDLSEYPHVQQSVLNYGLPALSGRTSSTVNLVELERELRQAIWNFEPRLLRNSIKLRLAGDPAEMNHNALAFFIEAELWAQPVPLRLYLKTEIDLEVGEVNVVELGAPGGG